ncbi:MAG TPA: type II secretion system major pseudopilin GspG [Kiritimatiellia bacterium]|nr:type II secretion system major pseudopilin GspG [Kiritimatiellia bacterium]
MHKKPSHFRPSKRAGFTLVELLVAIAILSILVGIVAVNVLNQPSEAKVAAAKAQIRTLKMAVQMYKTDNGYLPTMNQGLEALVTAPTTPPTPRNFRAGGYLDSRRLPLDPWNNPYIYLVPGSHGQPFEIISYGRDGQPGGEGDAADISSADL